MSSEETTIDGAGFAALGLDPALVRAVTALGYEEPTAIQREAIPALIAGRDVLGQAATGTGKTAAFALPLLQRLSASSRERPIVRALILVPTRELAMQVAEAVHKYGRAIGVRVLPIYGGQSIGAQLRPLSRGVDVVVATPGRALDHLRRKSLDLSTLEVLVLDEADEMLDMGFAEELDAILQSVPTERQTALFSATLAPRIVSLAKRHLRNPQRITIAHEKLAAGEPPRLREVAYVVPRRHKVAALARVLEMEDPTSAIVFCRTRNEVDELTDTLGSRGYSVESLHGGLSQEQRDRVMRKFRDRSTEVLVATDVAARGLDIEHVSHVINYDVPASVDAYVHRTGRTGRAGREGVAVTLLDVRERRLLGNIESTTKRKISIQSIPTLHDLRSRRIELTRTALEETLAAGNLAAYRIIIETLAEEHDPLDLAAAAMKLAEEARDAGAKSDDEEIPTPLAAPVHEFRQSGKSRPPSVTLAPRASPATFAIDGTKTFARIFIGAGREAGVAPKDLVGAIANEARVSSQIIGAIEIADRFSLVEVPEDAAEQIIKALRGTTLRGKKVQVKRDRGR